MAHPDYEHVPWHTPASGDRCVCGGVRYWHAAVPDGCDDCECYCFRPVVYDAGFLSLPESLQDALTGRTPPGGPPPASG